MELIDSIKISDSYRTEKLKENREPNDIDDILNAPPELLSSNIEKMVLREKIRDAVRDGKIRELGQLKARLDYTDVIEAELRTKYENTAEKAIQAKNNLT